MTDDTENNEIVDTTKASGAVHNSPGQILRAAREAKNMSVEELTGHTMLSRATVQALEEDDFGRLSQPVFVRGYYRKCAKVLEMPEAELMAAYTARTGVAGPKPASPKQVDVVPQDVTPGGPRVLAVLLLVGAVVAGAAVWFLLPTLQSGSTGVSDTISASGDAQDADTSSALAAPDSAPSDSSLAASPDANASAQPAPEPRSVPRPQLQTPAPAEPVPGSVAQETETQPEVPQVPGGVHFRFNQASWVDIRNGNNKRLLGGIIDGDTEYTYPAEDGPFDVRLGYTPGIEMYVNGQAFDLEAKTASDNTARFILQTP